MNNKTLAGLVLAIIIILGVAYFIWNGNEEPAAITDNMNDQGASGGSTEGPSSAMLAEDNAIAAADQDPDSEVTVAVVHLAAPGYVVIHEDADGSPGAIIGSSRLLAIGESAGVEVDLSRPMRDGEVLYAMLHFDIDSNGSFNASVDTPVPSQIGGSVMTSFRAISGAGSGESPAAL